MRNAEVIRQWKILKRIETSRYVTASDLADEHDVALRTIRRDIEALQEAGFPLYDDKESGRKVWRLLEGYSQKTQTTFTMAEMAALYFGRHLMTILSGSPFADDLDSAFVRSWGFAREEHAVPRPHLRPVRGSSLPVEGLLGEEGSHRDPRRCDAARTARRHVVLLGELQARQTVRSRSVPGGVLPGEGAPVRPRRGVWRGSHVRCGAHRAHRLDGRLLRDSEGARYRGPHPKRFCIAGGKAQEVVLRFDAAAAGSVKDRTWHESQKIVSRPDGSFDLSLNVAISRELKAWIRSLVPWVVAIKPSSLKDDIERDLSNT